MGDHDDRVRRAEARVGTVLKDKWRVERLLGVGGMAAVYRATHRNQKRVAIKMLHPEISSDPEIRARFLREGYVANSVGHPGAVAVDDDDVTDDGAAFLVMELLEGETLERRRERKGGKLPVSEVMSIADQLLDVLATSHDKGVIHRDLKPENLFLTTAGTLKVLDFGIARLREGDGGASKGATRTGTLMGTPAFMAPEQARGRWDMVDGQTDLWAVGATMFTLLSGRFVREAETVNEELALAITARAPSIATAAPDVPPPVVDLVDGALAYEKAGRWPDARAMQARVREIYHRLYGPEPAQLEVDAQRASITNEARAGTSAPVSTLAAVGSTGIDRSRPAVPRTVGVVAGVVVGLAAIGAIATRLLGSGSVAGDAVSAEATSARAAAIAPIDAASADRAPTSVPATATVPAITPAMLPDAPAPPPPAKTAATSSNPAKALAKASTASAAPASPTAEATVKKTPPPAATKADPFSRRN